jgi:hypothetical protein
MDPGGWLKLSQTQTGEDGRFEMHVTASIIARSNRWSGGGPAEELAENMGSFATAPPHGKSRGGESEFCPCGQNIDVSGVSL